MKDIDKAIADLLARHQIKDYDKQTKNDIIHTLSVYHEELLFQNDELKRVNQELQQINQEYESLFMDAPVGYLLITEDYKIEKFNHYGAKIFENYYLLNKNLSDFVDQKSQDKLYFFLKYSFEKKTPQNCELKLNLKSATKQVKLISNYLFSKKQKLIRLAIIDISREYHYRKQIEYLSFHDQLTDLYNRRFFEEEAQRLNVERMLPLGIIMADLNGLKLVNDAFGHRQGDELLINTAKKLKSFTREEDMLARLGGDEFVFLLPQTSEQELKKIMKRMDNACEGVGIGDVKLSVAFGYAIKNCSDQSLESLMGLAETRMYKNKLYKKTSERKNIIMGVLSALHDKNPREALHSQRVSELAYRLGEAVGLDQSTLINLKTAGLLHDIGKVSIDYTILDKTDFLLVREYEEIKKHAEIGYRILDSSREFADIAEIVLSHHERPDGKGYPRGLVNGQIPLESKIICICDAYDAMTSDRPYRRAKNKTEAISELQKMQGKQFDQELVGTFIEMINNESN